MGGDHFANFVDVVRSRRKEDCTRPLRKGTSPARSCTWRTLLPVGRTLNFDPETEQVIGDEEANRLLRGEDRGYRKPFVIPEKV
jgi:hypothetical protein